MPSPPNLSSAYESQVSDSTNWLNSVLARLQMTSISHIQGSLFYLILFDLTTFGRNSFSSLKHFHFLVSVKMLFSWLFSDPTDHVSLVFLARSFSSTQPLNVEILQSLDLAPLLSISKVFSLLYLQHMEVPGLGVELELHHRHSNARSEPHLQPITQLTTTPDP